MFRVPNTEYPCQYQLLGTSTQFRQSLSATTLIQHGSKSTSLLSSSIFTALLTVIQLLNTRAPSNPSLCEAITAIISLPYKAEWLRDLDS